MRHSSHRFGCLLLALLLCAGGSAFAANESGPAVLASFIARHHLPFEMEELTLRLVGRNGDEETRLMRRYTRRFPGHGYRHLIIFDAPEAIAGTALLAWQRPGTSDRYWTYLPALGELREQSAHPAAGRRYFMGTDLTFEDLAIEDVSRYEYERMPDQVIDDEPMYVVRAVPASNEVARQTGYLHRDMFLRKGDYVLMRIDYYGRRGRLIKQLRAQSRPVAVTGQARRVDHLQIDNHQARHRTELMIRERKLDEASVPDHLFDPAYLAAAKHMRR